MARTNATVRAVKAALTALVAAFAVGGAAGLSSLHYSGTGRSAAWFAVALGIEVAAGAWLLRRRSSPARLAAAATAALAAVGACGLVGDYGFAFTAGVIVGVPLAWLIDFACARAEGGRRSRRRSLETALAAGLAVFGAAVAATVVPVVAAATLAIAAVAFMEAAPAALPRRAR